ncbi:glyoxylate/hydroxypyruvate reductase HPR3 [Salvia miltiorrhiza]|uniref:glyoxylate/hydroxypyruvate reductase HPR3 n=1 Tax=Salvia miltiorrhiza TaxID=226208 RepID=UPI0025ABE9E6|nr:glyoxylate/hydroxypyruvate reductase HPR3 [Salvia miltiorrhiza]
MAAADDDEGHQPKGTPPLLILHHLPNFKLPIFPLLRARYTVLDPSDEPPDPSFPTLSKAARLMLCAGPTPVTADDLDRYPALECVIGSSAGVNHFDLAACRRRGVRLTTAGDSFSDDVADYAVGLAIDVLRRVSAADRFVRAGSWPVRKEYGLGAKVSGKRVGIVGLGSIGSRVAKRFEAFGCSIAYTSTKMKPNVSYSYYADVAHLASNADILIVCSALTDETRHLINKDVMSALGKSGIIVNVGRGALVDEKCLVEMVVRGEIGGAGLDVFEKEPHVPQELFALDNVVLSPHHAVLTPDSLGALEDLMLANIQAFFSNRPLRAELHLPPP